MGCIVHRKLTNSVTYAICSDKYMEATISRGDRKDELKNGPWLEKAKDEFGVTIVAESKLKRMLA